MSDGQKKFSKADILIDFKYTRRFNFAMQQQRVNVIQSVSVLNNSDAAMESVGIKLTGEPKFFDDIYLTVPSVDAGAEYFFKDVQILPDYGFLSDLPERVNAEIIIETEIGGAAIRKDVHKIDLLAFDEWTGAGVMPELLAAFCIPADPAVQSIISEAAQLLKKENLSFNGYQSGDPNIVNKQLAAIYAVIRGRNVAYCMPPASFESGQKVRLPQNILDNGLGTCLDTTMLLCSCAEAVGVNPLIFLYDGHAFPGFWLKDGLFPDCISDDLAAIKKRQAGGVSEICALESTMVTSLNSDYTAAVGKGRASIDNNGDSFRFFIDIARARRSGILPLPVRFAKDGRYHAEREQPGAQAADKADDLRVVDVSTDGYALSGRFEKWKRDLLDVSLRNPLINYKVNKAGIPLLNFELEELEDTLADGAVLNVRHQPKENDPKVEDITKLYTSADERLKKLLRDELNDRNILSSLGEEELNKKLTKLFRSAKLSMEETGANTLYLALGFLKWREKEKNKDTDRFAPVVLMPLQIVRKSATAGYTVALAGDEHTVNLSLIEMLRTNFKLDATALTALPAGEKGIDLFKALTMLRKLVLNEQGWDVIEAASIGLFQFSDFMLWNDLKEREAQVRRHPLTGSLISAVNDPRLFERKPDINAPLYLPLAADSSQTAAVRAAVRGDTFVLHGPPGTGKSQTITNIIANALAGGKRVLFVAEKAAALNVVKKRLTQIGLSDFCLELHSNKMNKKDFFAQFDGIAEIASKAKDVNYPEAVKRLDGIEGSFEELHTALGGKRKCGFSVYDALNRLKEAGGGDDGLIRIAHTDVTEDGLKEGERAFFDAVNIGKALGEPVNSPWYGIGATGYTFEFRDSVAAAAASVIDAYPSFTEGIGRLSQLTGLELSTYKQVADAAVCVTGVLHYNNKNGFVKFMAALFSKRYKNMRKLKPYKKIKKALKENAGGLEEISECIGGFIKAESVLAALLVYGDKFETCSEWAFEIFHAAGQYGLNIGGLKEYCAYVAARQRCAAYPQLTEALAAFHGGGVSSDDAPALLTKSFYDSWLKRTVSEDGALAAFSPGEITNRRASYAQMIEFVAELSKKDIYLKCTAKYPDFKYASMSSAEPGILLKAVKSRGRGMTIRQVFEKVPGIISRTKPCMLMSPLSAAQYLPAGFPEFDIVIFDEASQVRTCQAAGAISRGISTVMVGDPNQLPPTSFFMAQQDDDELDIEMQDLESILDDMLTLNISENKLLWHYRSEHESLIAFSNNSYYNNELITFPSVDDVRSRVVFRDVDGVYERGGKRINPKEAETVVGELFRCLSDPELSKLSYGIVTFNVTQQSLIEDLIDKRLAKSPALEKHFNGDNAVFVKNIESVQGDERDVIIFSLTYGPDKDNKMTVNFGPINKDGGWRRLNVAVTRACKRIYVYSTMRPEMIDLSRTSSAGVKGLKEFMAYAISPRRYFSRAVSGAADAFVRSVDAALTGAGYKTLVNLGRSANKIDIAVINDDGLYSLGIICDGTPLNGASAKDRECGRDGTFARMGWRICRVYALEWWQNPAGELHRIEKALNGESVLPKQKLPEELVKRHEEVSLDPKIAVPQTDYTAAEIKGGAADKFFTPSAAAKITAQIKEILNSEAPIAKQVLYKKIAAAWEQRQTQKYNEYIDGIVKKISPFKNSTQTTEFFWQDKQQPQTLDLFRSNADAGRKADEIAKEEYAVAAYYIMQNALSIHADDLTRETARLFGMTKTPTATARISYALSLLTAQGKVQKSGDVYKLK